MDTLIIIGLTVILLFICFTASKYVLKELKWLSEPPSYTAVIRSFVTITFVGAYAYGFLLVVQEVTTDSKSLENVEGFGLVLALVGGYVERIIDRLYQEQK